MTYLIFDTQGFMWVCIGQHIGLLSLFLAFRPGGALSMRRSERKWCLTWSCEKSTMPHMARVTALPSCSPVVCGTSAGTKTWGMAGYKQRNPFVFWPILTSIQTVNFGGWFLYNGYLNRPNWKIFSPIIWSPSLSLLSFSRLSWLANGYSHTW